jgi:trehalose-phosphatase
MPRLKPLWQALAKCSERLHGQPATWVACDFDGTLTPIQDHPDSVSLDPRCREALAALATLEDVRVGVFSGRRLDDLAPRVGVPGIYLSGSSGLETMDPRGHREAHLAPGDEPAADLKADLAAWCERFEGAWVEEKHGALAIHYRAVARRMQSAFGAGLRRRMNPLKDRFHVVHGKKVFEIQPASSGGKRGALERWIAGTTPESATLFFFGDDTNDEPCFAPVREHGGFGVAVGRLASRAEYALGTPGEVVWFLEWLHRECAVVRAQRLSVERR